MKGKYNFFLFCFEIKTKGYLSECIIKFQNNLFIAFPLNNKVNNI